MIDQLCIAHLCLWQFSRVLNSLLRKSTEPVHSLLPRSTWGPDRLPEDVMLDRVGNYNAAIERVFLNAMR